MMSFWYLRDDEKFQENMIKYLSGIIVWNINQNKSCKTLIFVDCIDDNVDHIHPCTIGPPNIDNKIFFKLFQNEIYKLMNMCKWHVCNPTCYKRYANALKTLCRYGFLQPLINETHFNVETRLSHIKRTNKWLNNGNPWILSTSRCNHD